MRFSRKFIIGLLLVSSIGLVGCSGKGDAQIEEDARAFLSAYTKTYQTLGYTANEAEWKSNTYILEGDEMTKQQTTAANEALAEFTGSTENITQARAYLAHRETLPDILVRQLDAVLYAAAANPQTVPELVKEKIAAEADQTSLLYGFAFVKDGDDVTTNQIDKALADETDLEERLKYWNSSKEVGKVLKPGLANLQRLRNQTVQALDYDDYFAYQVSDYGMTSAEMIDLNHRLIEELRPLYRELHTYARYELAKKYGVKEVPAMLPAHWLPNRWGQDWNSILTVEGLDLNASLEKKSAEWLVQQGERFYVSMGFEELPQSFWEKSDMYPLPPGTAYKKNNHASAWHMDLDKDVRCLMSVVPNSDWYETVHHELGHIYYYIAYTRPEVPIILRGGANRAYHEAIGSLLGLAATQKPFMAHLELIPANTRTDEMRSLLKAALNYVVFIPWSAGVMTDFEHALYAENLPVDQYNAKWWELKRKHQGIVPPAPRGEAYADAASKTHINNDAAQYYDYALSYVILFQFHDHIARNILKQDPRNANYYGSKEVGTFLNGILEKGASEDWRALTREKLGEDISAEAMLNYFEPLTEYLKVQNKGRKHTL